MIKPGDAIYRDKDFRLFSRRSKKRVFLGWSHGPQTMEEGVRLNVGTKAITDPNGFGMEHKEEEGDFKILLP